MNYLQKRIDALPSYGGTITVRRHVLDQPLNMRGKRGVILKGRGAQRSLGKSASLITTKWKSDKPWPVIDMTGARDCYMCDLAIESNDALCGILMAREPLNGRKRNNADHHSFERVYIRGLFQAGVYNIGSEVDRWDTCSFMAVAPTGVGYLTSSFNGLKVESPYGEIAGGHEVGKHGGQSNLVHTLRDCVFRIPNKGILERCAISIEPRTEKVLIDNPCFITYEGDEIRALIRIGHPTAPRNYAADREWASNNDVVDVQIRTPWAEPPAWEALVWQRHAFNICVDPLASNKKLRLRTKNDTD